MYKSLAILLLFNLNWANSQNLEPLITGENITLNSSVFESEKNIFISLPESYEYGQQFPVLYVLDGQGLFILTHAISQTLAATHNIEEFIVVGINHQNRYLELRAPGAKKLQQFIDTELKPFMQSNYLISDYSLLAGHSLGGSMVLDQWLTKPTAFNAYIAVSPVLNREGTPQIKTIARFLNQNPTLQTNLFLAKGNEQGNYKSTIKALTDLLKSHSSKHLNWSFQEFEKYSHGAVVVPAITEGLVDLFQDRIMPALADLSSFNSIEHIETLGGFEPVEKYYQKYAKLKGHDFGVPDIVYSRFVWIYFGAEQHDKLFDFIKKYGDKHATIHYYLIQAYFNKKDFKRARQLIDIELKNNSNNAQAWHTLGQIYEDENNTTEAIQSYKNAIKLAKNNHLKSVSIFTESLNQVEKQLKNKK